MNRAVLASIARALPGTLLGLAFVASAVLKLVPLEAFEVVVVNQFNVPWALVPLATRLLVVLELSLGLALVLRWHLRLTTFTALGLLSIFSLALVSLLLSGRGDENCGCFGELLPMNAAESLLKNAVLALLALASIWLNDKRTSWRFGWLSAAAGAVFAVVLFIVSPLPSVATGAEPKLDQSITQHPEIAPLLDADGNAVIVLLYSGCVHCEQLATLLAARTEGVQAQLLVYGKAEMVNEFVAKTGITHLPWTKSSSRELFHAAGGSFPTVFQVNAHQFTHYWQGPDVNMALIDKLLEK